MTTNDKSRYALLDSSRDTAKALMSARDHGDREAIYREAGRAFLAIEELTAALASTTAQPPVAAVPEGAIGVLFQHGETGRTRVVMRDQIADCDARWFKVGDLVLAATPSPAPAAPDDAILYNIPPEVIDAERTVSEWFKRNNIAHWQLGGSASRRFGNAAPAAQGEAEFVLWHMQNGFSVTYHKPWAALTDEANKDRAWSVERTEAPFCSRKRNSAWSWFGPTPAAAIRACLEDFGKELPAPAAHERAEVRPPVLTDADIEAAFKAAGGKWDGDRWVIEDADLHPFVRGITPPSAADSAQGGATGVSNAD